MGFALLCNDGSELTEDPAQSLQALRKEMAEEEASLQRRIESLRSQLGAVDAALTERSSQLEQVTARVSELEEQGRALQRDQEQSALLQDRLADISKQLTLLPCVILTCAVFYKSYHCRPRFLRNRLCVFFSPCWVVEFRITGSRMTFIGGLYTG